MKMFAPRRKWFHSWPALLLIALVAVFSLAGCGANGSSGSLLAASVNGQGISLDDYQQMMNYFTKYFASSNAISTQSPSGRQGLAQAQTYAFNFLISLELARQQASACGVKVTQQEITAQQKQLQSTADSVLKDPSDPNWTLFHALATTPRVLDLYGEQQAYQAAFIKVLNLPTAHVRVVIAPSRSAAETIQQQLEQGTDLAKLAAQSQGNAQLGVPSDGDLGVKYVGQLLPEFDAINFSHVVAKARCYNNLKLQTPAKYHIYAISGQYAVIETTNVANAPLAALNDPQTEGNVFNGWLANIVRPNSKIEIYTLPVTADQATATPQQQPAGG